MNKRKIFKYCSVKIGMFVMLTLYAGVLGGCGKQTSSSVDEKQASEIQEIVQQSEAEQEESEILTSQAEETQIEEPPQVQNITITATGDCTLGAAQIHSYEGSFHAYYDKYGEDYFFEGVRDIFSKDDFTLINLECVLTESDNRVEKTYNLKGRPEYVGIMTSGSVEGCSLGNNHSRDYGEESLADTEKNLDGANIIYGYNEHTSVYPTKTGEKIGVVSASLLSQSAEMENYIRDGIAQLREQGADIIIACCHWGIEREYYPNAYQKETAHQIIDWGADLVIGSHPHVLQGMEYYNGKMICYSLGNFCFGGNKNPSDKNTAIFQQTFHFIDGQLQKDLDARIIPCTVSSAKGYNDYQPTVAEGEKQQEILQKMKDYSSPYGELDIDEDGSLSVTE